MPNGMTYTGGFLNGMQHGKGRIHFEGKSEVKEGVWDNGKLVESKTVEGFKY